MHLVVFAYHGHEKAAAGNNFDNGAGCSRCVLPGANIEKPSMCRFSFWAISRASVAFLAPDVFL